MRATVNLCLSSCLLAIGSPASAPAPRAPRVEVPPSALVDGVWAYTGLTPRGGKELALTGLFVFHDGYFVQHAINDGDPLASQGGQGHFGGVRDAGNVMEITAEVAAGTSPLGTPPLSLRFGTEHQVTPAVEGDALTLTFGSGTVQKFKRVGRGEGTVHSLDKGGLALVDGHFVLVATRDGKVWAGSGRYARAGTKLTLEASRWFTADEKGVTNVRDRKLGAELDGKALRLEDGTTFDVVQR